MTFSAAAETLLTGDRGKVYTLDHRQCEAKLIKLTEKVIKDATTMREETQCIAVTHMRQNLSPSLKTYVDVNGSFDIEDFHWMLSNSTYGE